MPRKITLDRLAQMVVRGFAETASKKDFEDVSHRLQGIENRFDALLHSLELIQENLRELARDTQGELFDLRERVERLERKTGLRK